MIRPSELSYQIGNIVRICKEPKRAKRDGFLLGSEHVIVEPPAGHLNCAGVIWVKNKNGITKSLRFYEYFWGGKKANISNHKKRIRLKQY